MVPFYNLTSTTIDGRCPNCGYSHASPQTWYYSAPAEEPKRTESKAEKRRRLSAEAIRDRDASARHRRPERPRRPPPMPVAWSSTLKSFAGDGRTRGLSA